MNTIDLEVGSGLTGLHLERPRRVSDAAGRLASPLGRRPLPFSRRSLGAMPSGKLHERPSASRRRNADRNRKSNPCISLFRRAVSAESTLRHSLFFFHRDQDRRIFANDERRPVDGQGPLSSRNILYIMLRGRTCSKVTRLFQSLSPDATISLAASLAR